MCFSHARLAESLFAADPWAFHRRRFTFLNEGSHRLYHSTRLCGSAIAPPPGSLSAREHVRVVWTVSPAALPFPAPVAMASIVSPGRLESERNRAQPGTVEHVAFKRIVCSCLLKKSSTPQEGTSKPAARKVWLSLSVPRSSSFSYPRCLPANCISFEQSIRATYNLAGEATGARVVIGYDATQAGHREGGWLERY